MDKLAEQHMKEWKEMEANKRTVWLNVSIDIYAEELDDELAMEYANDVAVEAGFIVDDMGIVETKEDKA